MMLFCSALLLALFSGMAGIVWKKHGALLSALFLGGAACLGISAALQALFGNSPWRVGMPATPLGSPGMLHFDGIAAFFALPIFLIPACGALFGIGYWKNQHENAQRLRLLYGLLTAALAFLSAASHAITFLLGWEIMAITAFFLVITEDRSQSTRKAAWVYLVATHTGTLCLFGAFGLLTRATGSFQFLPLPAGFIVSPQGKAAFTLFLIGCGLKMGAFPLHFWLPGAHAAAPSHVSAFMSGVLIKMGVLGLVRLLSWIPDPPLPLGALLITLGAVSGILGVLFALGQHDIKRLLAYHSIENIGIILLGLGMGSLGKSLGSAPVMFLGYAGGLLHVLNHGLFKSLLFLGAGSVIEATGKRNIEQLGALATKMPRTTKAFLAGSWAICGLPPLNGFISEFLIYLSAFFALGLGHSPWPVLVITSLALIGALALACFAKVFGIGFLGHARSKEASNAKESPSTMLWPMEILGVACVIIGLLPCTALWLLKPAVAALASRLTPGPTPDSASGLASGLASGVIPGSQLTEACGLYTLTLLSLAMFGLVFLFWRHAKALQIPVSVPAKPGPGLPTWDCGYAAPSAKMQYSASSFAEGFVFGFRKLLLPKVHWRRIHALFPSSHVFHSDVPDPMLDRLSSPLLKSSAHHLARLRFFQSGHLSVYLLYIMITLLVLLYWMAKS